MLILCMSTTGWTQKRYVDSLFSKIDEETFTYKDSLQLDVYSASKDNNKGRPLILVVHGGAFMGGSREGLGEIKFSRIMAAKGYLVASIDYRLTLQGKSFGCDCPADQKIETFRAATDHILDALYYLSNSKFAYDRSKIILLGSSAGAEAVLNTAFLQQHFAFDDLWEKPITISGVISLAGAMVDADYITKENAIPTLLVHGMKDTLVPYATAAHHYCNIGTKGYIILSGARTIADKLRLCETSSLLAYAPNGNHDWSWLGYKYSNMIAEFIDEAVLENKLIQTEIDIENLAH